MLSAPRLWAKECLADYGASRDAGPTPLAIEVARSVTFFDPGCTVRHKDSRAIPGELSKLVGIMTEVRLCLAVVARLCA